MFQVRSTVLVFVVALAFMFGQIFFHGTANANAPAAPGDVDCDGRTIGVDALLVLQWDARLMPQVRLPCFGVGDVNGDGKVGTVDAQLILQYEVGFNSSFPTANNATLVLTNTRVV